MMKLQFTALILAALLTQSASAVVIIDDHFDNSSPGTGGATAINGGFTKATNGAGGSGALSETGSRIQIATTGGNNDNSGLVSKASFDPSEYTNITAIWAINSMGNPSANGVNLTLQDGTGFYGNETPRIAFQIDVNNNNRFYLKGHNGGSSHTFSNNPIVLGQALDGFTLEASFDEAGWAYTATGLNSLASASGNWTASHNYDTLFSSDTHVTGFIQKGGGSNANSQRRLNIAHYHNWHAYSRACINLPACIKLNRYRLHETQAY